MPYVHSLIMRANLLHAIVHQEVKYQAALRLIWDELIDFIECIDGDNNDDDDSDSQEFSFFDDINDNNNDDENDSAHDLEFEN